MDIDGRKTLLLAEDEALIAIAESLALEQCGYEVLSVDSGQKAIEAIRERGESTSCSWVSISSPRWTASRPLRAY
jgi:CheY-like chemotaxis protein